MASSSGHRTGGSRAGGGASGSRSLRVPHLSVKASSAASMRGQRVSSGSGGASAGGAANALVSFAPHGYSPSPSQASELLDLQRGSSWILGGDQSRATTAPGGDGVGVSVFRSRVSPNFRQALAEAKERTATRRLTAQQVREQRRSNNQQPESVSRLDGDTLVEEEDADIDADDVFDETAVVAVPGGSDVTTVGRPPDPGTVADPRRRRALQRWALMREIVDEIHKERHAKKAEGWSMFFKHVRAMSEAEKTRQDLYERYNIFGDSKSDFMTSLPVIPDELLLAAGIPLPTSRNRRQKELKRPPKR